MNKLINKILAILIIIIMFCGFTNIVYAETWEERQEYINSNYTNEYEKLCSKIEWAWYNDGWNIVTDAELDSMIHWKNNKNWTFVDSRFLDLREDLAKQAGAEQLRRESDKKNNSGSSGSGSSNSGSSGSSGANNNYTNIPAEERKKKRDALFKEVADFCSADVATADEATVKKYIDKVTNWQRYGGDITNDFVMNGYLVQLNDRLQELTGKRDNTVYDENNQYLSSGASNSSSYTGALQPDTSTTSTATADHTVDEIINEAESFIKEGQSGGLTTLNGDNLQKGSNTIYNILLSIGIVVAVAVGAYLGLKFVSSSAEDKAKVKEALVPYTVGCIIIFGAFIIWRLAINLLGGL